MKAMKTPCAISSGLASSDRLLEPALALQKEKGRKKDEKEGKGKVGPLCRGYP